MTSVENQNRIQCDLISGQIDFHRANRADGDYCSLWKGQQHFGRNPEFHQSQDARELLNRFGKCDVKTSAKSSKGITDIPLPSSPKQERFADCLSR
jgi:hypothetical protein